MTGLAVEAGASEEVCRSAVVRRNKAGEEIISRFLGIPAHELWPDRYHANGVRKDLRRERALKSTTVAPAGKTNEARTRADRAQASRRCDTA